MKHIRHFFRLLHINFILARHGLDKIILSLHLFAPLRFLIYLNPWNWFRGKDYNRGEAIRHALEDLGPIFVKFGQALSTRRDLVADDIAFELTKLQDNVAPFPFLHAKKIIESEFKKPLATIFAEFDPTPLASASIAQVHAATLHDGSSVIVKIRRPNIRKQISRDINLMYMLADLAERYWSESKRLHPREIVKEFDKTIHDELDFQREAANASQLRRNFENSDKLYVPEVYWSYTHEKVLVVERIYGIPVTNIEQLKAHNINIKKLAELGVEIFFTQVFRDSFFHADMHPGNIFVSPDHPENPRYICVDFGIIGSLDDFDKRYLAENFHAFFNRDYHRVAQLHVESGWVPPDTRVTEFEGAIRTVCEPIFERPLSEISVAQMLMRLFQTGRRFNMEIQPQLILLQKTLFAIEGLGRQLYPDLDLWSTAKPYLEKWLKEQVSPKQLLKSMQSQVPAWLEKLPEIPTLIHDVLRMNKQHHIQLLETQKQIKHHKHHTRKLRQKLFAYGFGTATFLMLALTIIVSDVIPSSINLSSIQLGLIGVGSLSFIYGLLNKPR